MLVAHYGADEESVRLKLAETMTQSETMRTLPSGLVSLTSGTTAASAESLHGSLHEGAEGAGAGGRLGRPPPTQLWMCGSLAGHRAGRVLTLSRGW
jgi:hypothetical protein